jgi:TatD DNase family protein
MRRLYHIDIEGGISVIIDSHAHYNNAYKKPFRYLTYDKDGYALKEGDREQLFQELLEANILYTIEPGVSLESCKEVLNLAAQYPGRIFPAMGIHPTRSIYEKWSDRKKLDAFAKMPGVVAIGEIGLDYHYKREEQHRLKQHLWFIYQLNLAWKMKLPVILHVRDAHEDALRILRWHPARKLGGVIHCFYGSKEIAEQYLKLGYHIGIGGSVLQLEERANDLWEAITSIPLDRILVETDAPFILPYCKDVIQPKLLRRARNTSLILPAVIKKIAKLKGISDDEVEQATAENTIRLFHLPIHVME